MLTLATWPLTLALLFAPAAATHVAAVHATLISSEPAASSRVASSPRRVRLVFSEPIEGTLARVALVTAGEAPVSLAAAGDPTNVRAVVAPVDSLAPGSYRVEWRVVSADGHPVSGTFVFTVGDSTLGAARPRAPPPVPLDPGASEMGPEAAGAPLIAALLRGAGIGALMASAGMLLFLAWAAPSAMPADRRVRRAITIFAIAAPVLLAAHLAAWLVHTAPDQRLSVSWASSAFATAVGRIELWRTGLALLVLWAWALARRPRLALLFATGALLASSAAGHSAAIHPLIAIPAKSLHLLAAAVWLGGLAWLIVRPANDDAARFGADARRVSSLALLAVIVVAASGIAQTLLFLPSLRDLASSAYGWIVLGKVAGLLVLVAFGAYNRRRLMPRLVVGDAGAGPPAHGGGVMLRSSVAREIVIMVVVILLGGWLAYVPPPGEQAGGSTPTHASPS